MSKHLNDHEINLLELKIGKPTYKFMNKLIDRELSKIPNYKNIDVCDLVNLMLVLLVNISTNQLKNIMVNHKNVTGTAIDEDKLLNSYIDNLKNTFNELVKPTEPPKIMGCILQ